VPIPVEHIRQYALVAEPRLSRKDRAYLTATAVVAASFVLVRRSAAEATTFGLCFVVSWAVLTPLVRSDLRRALHLSDAERARRMSYICRELNVCALIGVGILVAAAVLRLAS
jgi:hypothetical protein